MPSPFGVVTLQLIFAPGCSPVGGLVASTVGEGVRVQSQRGVTVIVGATVVGVQVRVFLLVDDAWAVKVWDAAIVTWVAGDVPVSAGAAGAQAAINNVRMNMGTRVRCMCSLYPSDENVMARVPLLTGWLGWKGSDC